MRVLIITGGTSSERRISFMSAKQVKKGLEEMGHKVKLFDLKKGHRELRMLVKKFDVIFPIIHGEEGEGGKLQQFLASQGVPFVGGDPKGFKTGWYKIPFKKFCEQNNIQTSPWKTIPPSHSEPQAKNLILQFGFPAVLKSSSGGSSKEVVILKSLSDLNSYLCKKLLKSKLPLFVEKHLPGVEITVGILNNRTLPVVEIIPPAGGWFDYQNKYWGKTKEIPFAPSVPKQIQKKAQQIAQKIHTNLKLGQLSRIDFIVTRQEDSKGRFIVFNGNPYVLEVNTIPGLTAYSLFPKAAQAVGIPFSKLLDKIVKMAYENKISKA